MEVNQQLPLTCLQTGSLGSPEATCCPCLVSAPILPPEQDLSWWTWQPADQIH